MFTIFFKFCNKRVSSEIQHVESRNGVAWQFSACVSRVSCLHFQPRVAASVEDRGLNNIKMTWWCQTRRCWETLSTAFYIPTLSQIILSQSLADWSFTFAVGRKPAISGNVRKVQICIFFVFSRSANSLCSNYSIWAWSGNLGWQVAAASVEWLSHPGWLYPGGSQPSTWLPATIAKMSWAGPSWTLPPDPWHLEDPVALAVRWSLWWECREGGRSGIRCFLGSSDVIRYAINLCNSRAVCLATVSPVPFMTSPRLLHRALWGSPSSFQACTLYIFFFLPDSVQKC